MHSTFPLFKSHLDLAHNYWGKLIQPGDIVIDATCGNGQDTLVLAHLALSSPIGQVYACDIQSKAIELSRHYLTLHLTTQQLNQVQFILGCHSTFPQSILPETVKLIAYNLGYLPGGNKQQTTLTATTLQSICQAQKLLMPGGAISLTCYPGHSEGALEEDAVLAYAASLPPQQWNCCHHRWLNRQRAPSLLLLQKGKSIQPNPTTV